MANRVLPADVKLILDTELTDDQLTAFIDAAHLLVENELADADCHDEASLTIMEHWRSAQFATARERETTSEKIETAAESYGGTGLSSRYWEQAAQLDCSGQLVNQGNVKFTASFIGGAGC